MKLIPTLAAFALVVFPIGALAQGPDVDGFASDGGLGTTRIVDHFDLTDEQMASVMEDGALARLVVRVNDNRLAPGSGYAFYANRTRGSVADCTNRSTTCLVVERREGGRIVVLTGPGG